MNKIFKLLVLIVIAFTMTFCTNEDGPSELVLRDYQDQYESDLADIELFLKTHSYEVVNNPGSVDDQDVTFTEVEAGDPSAIWESDDLLFRTVAKNDVEYKIYYLKFREGGGADPSFEEDYPTNVDAVLVSYVGSYLFHKKQSVVVDGVTVETDTLKNIEFESVPYPNTFFNLDGVVQGWGEVFPQFGAGDVVAPPGLPLEVTNFGAGVMFLPSGMAYYGASQASIPSYSPLIFTFKLYDMKRLDQDGDQIPSYYEDLDGDRYLRLLPTGVDNPDDSDGDGVPDYLDVDDDNDDVITKIEIKRPRNPANPNFNAPDTYYHFNSMPDNPATAYIDESKGIPSCGSPADYTTPTRLRVHLDPSCHPNAE